MAGSSHVLRACARLTGWCAGVAVLLVAVSCGGPAVQVEHGRPEALAPIVGAAGAPIEAAPDAADSSGPLADFAVDIGPFEAAWPDVADELPRLVQAAIARGTWTGRLRGVWAADGVLRVRHTPAVVNSVKAFVADLQRQLLRSLDVHVAFVELPAALSGRLLATRGGAGGTAVDATPLRAAVRRGEARTLAEVVLRAPHGRWVDSDAVSNQMVVSGLEVASGSVVPRVTTLASGFTVQAAAWFWGAERAVLACTGLYTGPGTAARSVVQRVHRELPNRKADEHEWEVHEPALPLHVRDVLEFQGQLTVDKGRWTLAAVLPRNAERAFAVLVKVDWQAAERATVTADPQSGRGYVLDVIPVALPTDTRRDVTVQEEGYDNRRDINLNEAGWFRSRAKKVQTLQRGNVYNFQAKSGSAVNLDDVQFSTNAYNPADAVQQGSSLGQTPWGGRELTAPAPREGQGNAGLLPEELDRLRLDVMRAAWPEGTALEFMAGHVFVVHRPELTAKVRRLLEETERWRNQRVHVDVLFPELAADRAEALAGGRLAADDLRELRKGNGFLPPAYLAARGGAWAEIFAGEMHAVLSAPWAPDRSSPPAHVYWRGSRLAVLPFLGPAGADRLSVRWRHYQLDNLEPQTLAATVLQQPADAIWDDAATVALPESRTVVLGLHGAGGDLRALLLGAQTAP